jgi:hypothetical protein
VLNIDELGARVGCLTDRRKPLPLFVIAPRKQIIDNWINEKLISKEKIATTLTGYTNNKVAL